MTEWFEEWFGEEYLDLYPSRDDAEGARAIALIRSAVPWETGWRVLDVACGAGRHARALAAAGARCVGLDLSAILLREAQSTTPAWFVRADMRRIPIRPQSMDLTVNLFTSFGYFDQDAEHRQALEQMVGTIRPGGWFVIDFLNAATVRRTLVPEETLRLDGRTVRLTRSISADGRYVSKQVEFGDGRQFLERVRLFERPDIERMLQEAGIAIRHRFGDYSGGPLEPGAPRTILMGEVT